MLFLNKEYFRAFASALLLISGIAANYFDMAFFREEIHFFWFASAYIIVGLPVLRRALYELTRFDFANEFFLMSVATLGAFIIGEYAEAVAVMLFYELGELFQAKAVNRARGNIKALMDLRPLSAMVNRNDEWIMVHPAEIRLEETVMVRRGDKFPLDGEIISDFALVNTAALTGESKPVTIHRGEMVRAGSLNLGDIAEVRVLRSFEDSSLSRILKLVEEAHLRKAPTERFMRRFARYYTPVVMAMALMITLLPYFFTEQYELRDWIYRAFVFLVIACPCALYVSIPLGYFGGIGAASKNGILFKGADYLDKLQHLSSIFIDKTGTLTRGVFLVRDFKAAGYGNAEITGMAAALMSRSGHPVAKAVADYSNSDLKGYEVTEVVEIPARGMKGLVNGRNLLAGNDKFMQENLVEVLSETASIPFSCVHLAVEGTYAGYFILGDEVKEDSMRTIESLRALGVKDIAMLSGDSESITMQIASDLKIDHAHGGLLPEEKAAIVREYVNRKEGVIAFAGDGINDAPSIAEADVGIAMGAMGSDLAIETADVVIQTDQPSRIAMAIKIARATGKIVWQNIWLVFFVKFLFLGLGAIGVAGMWEAVFADMGVALAAIFNAIRIQHKKFA
jgi:Zn2+/Cd2+-exporting ATPase